MVCGTERRGESCQTMSIEYVCSWEQGLTGTEREPREGTSKEYTHADRRGARGTRTRDAPRRVRVRRQACERPMTVVTPGRRPGLQGRKTKHHAHNARVDPKRTRIELPHGAASSPWGNPDLGPRR